MKLWILLPVVLLYTIFIPTHAQVQKLKDLEKQIERLNDEFKYTTSIEQLNAILQHDTSSSYTRYFAYLLKSYTYKRLFDYDEAERCLNRALQEGAFSPQIKQIEAVINAEKAYVYFDRHQYHNAGERMNQLKADGYKYLNDETIAKLTMQEGYILMLEKNYAQAEHTLDKALILMEKSSPRDLPMVYGKKVELYGRMGINAASQKAFGAGIRYADDFGILKYKAYMYEVMRDQYERMGDFKSAFLAEKALSEFNKQYQAEQNNVKVKLFEKDMLLKQKEYELEQSQYFKYFSVALGALLVLLSVLLFNYRKARQAQKELLEAEYKRRYNELQLLSQELTTKIDLSKFHITEKQWNIIELLKQGKSNKQIGEEMFISENTVKYHIKQIYDELKIENRNQLLKFFQQ
jgi:DNA-binding CsgD family transcriptional regulator